MSIKERRMLFLGAVVVALISLVWGARQMASSPAEFLEEPSGGGADVAKNQARSPLVTHSSESAASSATGVSGSSVPKTVAASEKARIAPVINWSKYPGTLDSQANRALETRDGAMAMDLANKLVACDIAERLQRNPIPQSGDVARSPDVQAERISREQENQRIVSNCQTVVGGIKGMRSRLLGLAMDQGVVGAAVEIFLSGIQRPEVLKVVVLDANAGDIKSLIYVSAYKPSFFSIDASTQAAARWALQLAANDATVGVLVRPYFEMAESLSVPMGGEAKSSFDHSGLSDEAKSQAEAIAGKLIERVSAGKG